MSAQTADPMFTPDGRTLPGTPAARIEAAVGEGFNGSSEVHAGEVVDLCRGLDPKEKPVAALAALVANAERPGDRVRARQDDLRAALALARKKAAA